jgi:hypothetical protein
MPQPDQKDDLRRYLQTARDAVLWKLDGLSEYDVRRPMTPTGTNLLGLVKHLAGVEVGYFGVTFGRPFGETLTWLDADTELNADMWATAEEPREQITRCITECGPTVMTRSQTWRSTAPARCGGGQPIAAT